MCSREKAQLSIKWCSLIIIIIIIICRWNWATQGCYSCPSSYSEHCCPPFFGNNLDQDEHLKLFSTCRTPIRVLQGLHLASYSSMSDSHPDWSCFAQRRAGACFLPSFPSAATKAGTWFLPSCITTSLKRLAIPFLDTLQKNVLWNKHIIKSSSEKKWEIKRN